MPSPKDLTGDLGRLRGRAALVETASPPEPRQAAPRGMAFDGMLWLSGGVILIGLALEAALIIWMW